MKADIVINGATLVTDSAQFQASVAIKDGAILSIGAAESMPEAAEVVDARGKYILPGAIDAHVHFRDPGYTHKETWETGTASAAMGGVTTVFEMPNTNPPTGTVEALNLKLKSAEQAYVDFGIYGLLGEDNLTELEALIEGGVAGFKCFMGNTFGNLPSPPTGAILEGFEIVAKHGYRIALHAENASIMARRSKKLREAGRCDPLAHLDARPPVVATEAVSRAAILAEWTGARIHILHVSSGDELRPLREAKARGVDITAETCPHYLLLDERAYTEKKSLIRVNPPVREKTHQDQLWRAVQDGTIDMIATDHAPHSHEEKHRDDIWTTDCGFTGVQTQMPLMLTQVGAGRLSLTDYVRMTSLAPAKAFGLYPRKGALLPGSDADLVIIDMERETQVDSSKLKSKGSSTPFHGHAAKGAPVHTLVRGRFVMRDGALVTEAKGHGCNVRRIQQMPTPKPRNVETTTAAIVRKNRK
ncbi:allantoinase AllB [Nitrospirillum viridazoti]|uniref:allantoinase n=1 Tax=Nitrospirillum viridazoti CBAmc TaxID=1441467 RepID=A0A248JZ44_9PROT|nr:allantoinase AllB [Nitrospirillum amazonense]ASG24003.1 allantoinase [Nitrospirillum amazonense CBAmc]TWB44553.1 dihydroorotase [Nitrospirillum amazonense]